MNERLTAKDRALIKSAVRRAFSRSTLHRFIIDRAKISGHMDLSRPRVKTWYQCEICTKFCAGYELQVDHINPVIKITETFEQMTFDELIEKMWCDPSNLQAICKDPCHSEKTSLEKKQRKEHKKNVKSSQND